MIGQEFHTTFVLFYKLYLFTSAKMTFNMKTCMLSCFVETVVVLLLALMSADKTHTAS